MKVEEEGKEMFEDFDGGIHTRRSKVQQTLFAIQMVLCCFMAGLR